MGHENPKPPDAAVAQIANRQHGNVTNVQLMACGLTRRQIFHRVQAGRLFLVHPRVYAVGRPPCTPIQHAAAAVLACGPKAALSHLGALAVHGFAKEWPPTFDVIATVDRRPRGITVHHLRNLARADFTLRQGVPVTSLARTVLDCLPHLDEAAARRTVNNALHSRWLKHHELVDIRERFPHHPGATLLDPILNQTATGITLSQLEDAFLAFCRRYDLPTPVTNQRLGTTIVDATFPGHALIVELDSWEHHSDRQAFETDRLRDAVNLANGRPTIRITWRRLHERAEAEARYLKQILKRL